MLTKLIVRNFKRFEEATIDLSENVVLIGPNNSGKTTALQALALWDVGYRQWREKRSKESAPERRSGVAINRKDLISIPIPEAKLLWRGLHVRRGIRSGGKPKTENIRIEIIVEGVTSGKEWKCGLEFDYSNEEAVYCRPVRLEGTKPAKLTELPELDPPPTVAFLPPMSGLAEREFLKQPGEIGVLIGQGQTAQVLRNLCHQVYDRSKSTWKTLVKHIHDLFGVELLEPDFRETAEIILKYRERNDSIYDISCTGRGLQQTLLLLAHLYANPRTVLLLDEPDAHLEILRQRQIYNLLLEVAREHESQVIAASHSEVVLNEAANRGTVIAFVGLPHVLNDQPTQVRKALCEIGFEDYFQAEQTGWVLYLESSSDLAILQAFANLLNHPAKDLLSKAFVNYVATNLPQRARNHFYGLREAKKDLIGIALFDRLETDLQTRTELIEVMWQKREIENYLCTKEVLVAFATRGIPDDLFAERDRLVRGKLMEESIEEVNQALETLNRPNGWSDDIKASDEFLGPVFEKFSKKLKQPLVLRKSEYSHLVMCMTAKEVDEEVKEKLNAILRTAKRVSD
jgi:ABC-type taurine transport system ATPase subunit